MFFKKSLSLFFFICWSVLSASAQVETGSLSLRAPFGLMCDLIENAGHTYLNGYPSNLSLEETAKSLQTMQQVHIQNLQPVLSWIVNDSEENVKQVAYQVLVASSRKHLLPDSADMWNSGKIDSDNSVAVQYQGAPLDTNAVYYWKVKVWNNYGEESPYSAVSSFRTGKALKEHDTPRYPLQKSREYPVSLKEVDDNLIFVDFGKDAFGQLSLNLFSENDNDTVWLHFGEALTADQRIDRNPAGTIRYQEYALPLLKGDHTYHIQFHPDERNTGAQAIKMPAYIGEVMPFRYCEVEGYAGSPDPADVVRQTVHYPFHEQASYFHSSDTVLNAVWDLCKYSIKATSFAGIYVDGDRERIPYEADAYINQLCHYAVDREYSMGRYSHEYLIMHPTWPTEWILQSVLMAWNDYLYTGNIRSVAAYYKDLKAKTLMALAGEDGLISTRNGKMNREVLDAVHFPGKELRDIVDWPHSGILGLGKQEQGETDGFVFEDINTVVNAFHYRALVLMSLMAKDMGKTQEHDMFAKRAEQVKKAFNKKLFDKKRGVYIDGIGTDHSSLHANMFPLAFGLVPEKYVPGVIEFVKSRGMAASVYGSQFLMDAVYEAEEADYGLSLLASTEERSWYNMIRAGSTITMEAWDNKYKPNQDWNHAWGAVPANIIPRKLMGIEPLEPGFRKVRIKPQLGDLKEASVRMPTIRGGVEVAVSREETGEGTMEILIPANMEAEVWIPQSNDKRKKPSINGKEVNGKRRQDFTVVELGSGSYQINL